jgi:2-pyrone-4,6-dicarboxylate lactonase
MPDVLDAPLCLPPRPLRNAGHLQLPPGTCDSHLHVFAADAPLAAPRSYTPQIETLAGWLALAESFGIARGVLVQPSVYGLDNAVLLAALAAEPDRLRGIVVIPPDTGDAALVQLDRAGVRGVRINLRNKAGLGLEAMDALAPRIRTLGWHVQFQVGPDAIGTVAELCARHAIDGVIDHLAFMPLDPPGAALDALSRALEGGRVHAKISAPYRLKDTAGQAGYRAALATLAARHPDRLLWGSDWPHTELFDTVPDDDDLVALALEALPAETHDRVFAQNAEQLYWSH